MEKIIKGINKVRVISFFMVIWVSCAPGKLVITDITVQTKDLEYTIAYTIQNKSCKTIEILTLSDENIHTKFKLLDTASFSILNNTLYINNSINKVLPNKVLGSDSIVHYGNSSLQVSSTIFKLKHNQYMEDSFSIDFLNFKKVVIRYDKYVVPFSLPDI